MRIKKYLSPIDPDELDYYPSQMSVILGTAIQAYTTESDLPEIIEGGLVLVGVEEDRGAENNAGCANAPNEIRRFLYQLAIPNDNTSIIDLGNVITGQTTDDTYYAVAEIVAEVVRKKCTLIVLGGSHDLSFAVYKGYEMMNRIMNITTIDSRFDLETNEIITSRTWLRNIKTSRTSTQNTTPKPMPVIAHTSPQLTNNIIIMIVLYLCS